MNDRRGATGIRAVLRSGRPTERADLSDIELFDTVGAALEAGVARLRSATAIDGDPELRIAVDVGEAERAALEADGVRPHWRFRLDEGAAIEWDDAVRGPQRFEAATMRAMTPASRKIRLTMNMASG